MSEVELTAPKAVSINLNDIEKLILHKDYVNAELGIQNLIIGQMSGQLNLLPEGDSRTLTIEQRNIEAFQAIERIATLFTAMLGDKSYAPSANFFYAFVQNKKFVANLFNASRYRNTDHILKLLGLDQQQKHSVEDVKKLMMLLVPGATFELPWQQLASALPQETVKTFLGLMYCAELNMSSEASIQLNNTAAIAKQIPLVKFSKPKFLSIINNAYFNVSTLTGENKYIFKKWACQNYNVFMDSYLSEQNKKLIEKVKQREASNTKKKILIVHEHYTQRHAMYRCYHSMIAALKEDYEVVGLSLKGLVDENGKKDHHDFIEYEDNSLDNLNDIIHDVLKLEPDAILYTSIGMSMFGVLLGSVRLAPVQCVTPGHPSSTYLSEIDYMLMEDLGIASDNLTKILSEEPVVLSSSRVKVTRLPFDESLVNAEKDPDVCHIAINGVIPKVTDKLMVICQNIVKRADKKVMFHFFMSSPKQDIEYFAVLSSLRRMLPSSTLHPYASDYAEYMKSLSVCDFALPTIPFGGANSNIDLVRLNIPKLFILDESDLPGATDYYMWHQFGELSGLCSSEVELMDRAVEFVNDEKKLVEAKERLTKIDLEPFFVNDLNDNDTRLVEAFDKLL